MSPKQARGKPVDKRRYIFPSSFGAVLYEVLTGKQSFGGDRFGFVGGNHDE